MSQQHGLSFGTVATVMFPAITGFIGVLVGVYAANRNQRKLWIADNKRSEYRKLLTTLAKTFNGLVRIHAYSAALGSRDQRMDVNLRVQANVVLLDRLFIADEVKTLNLVKRWSQALREYDDNRNHNAFAGAFGRISQDIRKAADELIMEKDWIEWLDDCDSFKVMKEIQAPKK